MQQATTIAEVQSILLPVDFSAASNEALLFAAQLANSSSLPLVVLHVVHEGVHRPNYPGRNEKEQILPLDVIAERMLQDFMAEMREQHPDSEVLANAGMMVVSGLPATQTPEIVRLIGAGLIVMGGNGRTSLSKLIGGSVSERVIRQSHVPVTIIHSNGTVWEDSKTDVWRLMADNRTTSESPTASLLTHFPVYGLNVW